MDIPYPTQEPYQYSQENHIQQLIQRYRSHLSQNPQWEQQEAVVNHALTPGKSNADALLWSLMQIIHPVMLSTTGWGWSVDNKQLEPLVGKRRFNRWEDALAVALSQYPVPEEHLTPYQQDRQREYRNRGAALLGR